MTTLVLPATLTPGANENVNDLNSNLNAITSWANGSVDATNLASSAKPATVLGFYQPLYSLAVGLTGGVATTYFPVADGTLINGFAASAKAPWIVDLRGTTDYAVSGLTANMRIRALVAINATAPAINFTLALYPVTGLASAAGQIGIASVGTAVAAVACNAPAASSQQVVASSDFTMPSGLHVIGIGTSGSMAANSYASFTLELQGRHA